MIAVMSEEEAARILGLDISVMPTWTQGLLITDGAQADNPIIFASKGFRTLTGYTSEEVMGDAVAARRRFDSEILNYRKDGSPFWNQLSVGPLTTGTSNTLFVGLQFDVSSRHRRD